MKSRETREGSAGKNLLIAALAIVLTVVGALFSLGGAGVTADGFKKAASAVQAARSIEQAPAVSQIADSEKANSGNDAPLDLQLD